MKQIASFIELPWVLVALFSYFAALYNNANEKHFETFAPLLICFLAIVSSFLIFKEADSRKTSLLPYLRFGGVGFFGILAVYFLWLEVGSKYLKETALGLVIFYVVFMLLNFLILFGLLLFELYRTKPAVAGSEWSVYLKIILAMSALAIMIAGLYSYLMNSKIGIGQGSRTAESWTARNPHLTNVRLTAGDSKAKVRVTLVSPYGLFFWKIPPQTAHLLLQDRNRVENLERQLNQLLANDNGSTLSIPFTNWISQIDSSDSTDRLNLSTEIDVSGLTQSQFDTALEDLNRAGGNQGDIPLSWITSSLLRKAQEPNNPTAFRSACFEIAFTFLADLDQKSVSQIKNAIEKKDRSVFTDDQIAKIASSSLKPEDRPQVISALRLIRFTLDNEQL